MTEINTKTIELIRLAVNIADSVATDLKYDDQKVSDQTVEFVNRFNALYDELDHALDDEGTLQ